MTTYAILRTTKIKSFDGFGSVEGSMAHTLRDDSVDNSHINPNAKHKNAIIFGDPNWAQQLQELFNSDLMHKRDLKQGQSFTLAREFFMGMSPEYVKGKTIQQIHDWAKANVRFLQERFGEERVKFACLHMDEQTPHLVAYVVPLKHIQTGPHKGKVTLSDRELGLGGKKEELSILQDEYGLAMKKYGLERGVKGSKATHQSTAEWRREQKRRAQIIEREKAKVKIPTPPKAGFSDLVNLNEYAQQIAQTTAESVMDQMSDYVHLYLDERKKNFQLQAENKKSNRKLKLIEPILSLFEEYLSYLIGKKIQLNSTESLNESMEALKQVVDGVKEAQATQTPTIPEKRPQAPKKGVHEGHDSAPATPKPLKTGVVRGLTP